MRLLEVGRSLVSELDLENLLEQVLDTAKELTGARYAALGILVKVWDALREAGFSINDVPARIQRAN